MFRRMYTISEEVTVKIDLSSLERGLLLKERLCSPLSFEVDPIFQKGTECHKSYFPCKNGQKSTKCIESL